MYFISRGRVHVVCRSEAAARAMTRKTDSLPKAPSTDSSKVKFNPSAIVPVMGATPGQPGPQLLQVWHTHTPR
eukprot:3178798-Prymnesium_polylepis.1